MRKIVVPKQGTTMGATGARGARRGSDLGVARAVATLALTLVAAELAPAAAQPAAVAVLTPSFPATLSNTTPLRFGMDEAEAARALGAPLTYLRGRPGDETFLAIRTNGGSGLFDRRDRLYLQFRHRRLTGWKGDWGRNWMWR
jgi:hypothetical protein